ncbi:MAG: fused MFS/spermidine synthase [Coriobacteriia bacterium]
MRDSQDKTRVSGDASAFLVGIVVFVSGAVVMVLELIGSRLLAPFFGNSLFVWTSLIGVMLGFMALGGFLGGRLGDRRLSVSVLFWILLFASLSIALVAFTEGALLPRLAEGSSLRVAAVLSATILFAVPSTLLGMVSPYCTRLRLHALADSGATVGSLYALSTIGSISGTFAAGFWLIARIGSHDLVAWLAAAVLALSLLVAAPFTLKRTAALTGTALVLVAALQATGTYAGSFDTGYDRYFIGHETEAATMRPVVTLSRDAVSIESATYSDNGEPFLLDYYDYYDLALASVPAVRRTLLIGGGAFSYPRHQLEQYPDSSVDAVEIDPDLVDVATETFALDDDTRLNVIVEDGRTFLNGSKERYDAILIDAFKSASSVPYQLTTLESMRHCSRLLDDDGVVAMNIVASAEGPGSRFLWAEYITLKSVFPQVEVFAVYDAASPTEIQNISVIAGKSESTDLLGVLGRISPDLTARRIDPASVKATLDSIPLITDDFAPVDQYLMDL